MLRSVDKAGDHRLGSSGPPVRARLGDQLSAEQPDCINPSEAAPLFAISDFASVERAALFAARVAPEGDDARSGPGTPGDAHREATEALEGFIDAIVFTPAADGLRIELKGNLGAMSARLYKARNRQKRATSSCKYRWLRGLALD